MTSEYEVLWDIDMLLDQREVWVQVLWDFNRDVNCSWPLGHVKIHVARQKTMGGDSRGVLNGKPRSVKNDVA